MKKVQIGTDDFNKIRTGNYYYVDKTNNKTESLDQFSLLLELDTTPLLVLSNYLN